MTKFGFKVFQAKFGKDDIDMEKRLNSFFDENKNLIPRSITTTYVDYKASLAVVVLYEEIE